MIEHFFSSLMFSENFFNNLPRNHWGKGKLESLAEQIDRLLRFRDRSHVLYIDAINAGGSLAYVDVQIPLFCLEKTKSFFMYLFVIPALIALVIKLIVRIILYRKYGKLEEWSEESHFFSNPQSPSHITQRSLSTLTMRDLRNIDFQLPPLSQDNLEKIIEAHNNFRSVQSKQELENFGVIVKSKQHSDDILRDEDDIVFLHRDFPGLEFESVGRINISPEVSYSAQEWADLHMRNYILAQKMQMSELNENTGEVQLRLRKIRSEVLQNHVLIIKEI
ncbi:hypothetical protein [Chlamydia vaughanii]|uniref:hypothetical protein n=1 Tax=Chlamydia vaughanii TaxID=3112552 RepID=UPI0032B22B72